MGKKSTFKRIGLICICLAVIVVSVAVYYGKAAITGVEKGATKIQTYGTGNNFITLHEGKGQNGSTIKLDVSEAEFNRIPLTVKTLSGTAETYTKDHKYNDQDITKKINPHGTFTVEFSRSENTEITSIQITQTS